MRIMVFDVPAENGGALTILNDFYKEVINNENNNTWFFVVSKPLLKQTENIKVLRFPWIKKSWFHRLIFDYYYAPQLIKKYKIDKIVSFQNLTITNTKVPQILYVHQSLPFVDFKFKFRDNKKLWIYQNIIGKKILKSIKNAQKVIVQTEWMKQAINNQVSSKDILVIKPEVKNKILNNFNYTQNNTLLTFFYPAGPSKYKNHEIIVKSSIELKKWGYQNYKIYFTLSGEENNHIKELKYFIKQNNLPIEFIGSISRERVYSMYSNNILIFPSYIETFGLPLLEAKMHKSLILASDLPFSREILNDYPNVSFFNPFDHIDIAKKMKIILEGKFIYNENYEYKKNIKERKLIDILINDYPKISGEKNG